MAKKNYKWIARLIDKITKTDCPNNNHFYFYGREVNLQSGMGDYMDVYVTNGRSSINFNFDFFTKDLCLESYENYEQRDAIIKAFRSIYSRVNIDLDQPWDEEEKFYLPMLDNDEYDQEVIQKEYNALLLRKAA